MQQHILSVPIYYRPPHQCRRASIYRFSNGFLGALKPIKDDSNVKTSTLQTSPPSPLTSPETHKPKCRNETGAGFRLHRLLRWILLGIRPPFISTFEVLRLENTTTIKKIKKNALILAPMGRSFDCRPQPALCDTWRRRCQRSKSHALKKFITHKVCLTHFSGRDWRLQVGVISR